VARTGASWDGVWPVRQGSEQVRLWAAREGSWAEAEWRCVGVERERGGAVGPGEEWCCMGDAGARRSRLSSIDQASFSRSMGRL
jgi:hypothetical protein